MLVLIEGEATLMQICYKLLLLKLSSSPAYSGLAVLLDSSANKFKIRWPNDYNYL